MTRLEALKAMVEYENDNLFEKVLTDHGIDGSAAYTTQAKRELDLALADILEYMAALPDFREGSLSTKYSAAGLIAWRKRLLVRYGLAGAHTVNGLAVR